MFCNTLFAGNYEIYHIPDIRALHQCAKNIFLYLDALATRVPKTSLFKLQHEHKVSFPNESS